MANFHGFCLVFMMISLCFLSTSSSRTTPHTNTIAKNSSQIVVSIRDDLRNQEPFGINCNASFIDVALLPGEHYNRTLLNVDEIFECYAYWAQGFTNQWHLYETKRDEGHNTVYWSAKEDGIYHSFDGITWKLLQIWHGE